MDYPLQSSNTDSLWQSTRDQLPLIDSDEASREQALQTATDIHREFLDHYHQHYHQSNSVTTPASNSFNFDSWRRLTTMYRDALTIIEGEVQHLQHTHDLLGQLVVTLNPDTRKASFSSNKKGHDLKRNKTRFPIITFGNGSNVAVRTEVDGQDAWIWAVVRSVHNNQVEVEDVEDKNTFIVTENDVIPLPPDDYPEFPVGTVVLACYPETTAFYKGIVVATPKKGQSMSRYHIQFDNDNDIPYHEIQKNHITMYIADKVDRLLAA